MADPLPSSFFDASNGSTTFDLFLKREIYRAYAFYDNDNPAEFTLPAPIRDFWNQEDFFYGRLNTDMVPASCSPGSLSLIEENVKVVNFVAAAYREMKKEIEYCAKKGRFPTPAPPITNFKATYGYTAPTVDYNRQQRHIRQLSIRVLANDATITSFDDFLPRFLQLLKEAAVETSISRSSSVVSSATGILSSGLALEIGDYDADSDIEKIKDFTRSLAFNFYKNIALKYGFYIDMNAPWRLVANLSSPAMQKFMSLYLNGPTGPTSFFSAYTEPTFLRDISELQLLAVSTYNGIVRSRPKIKKQQHRNGKMRTTTILRQPVRLDQVEDHFSYLHWLRFYVQLKNVEKGTKFSEARLDHIFNNSKNIVKTLDKTQALRYINKKFDDLRFINGSLNYDVYKRYYASLDKSKWSFKNFEEFYTQVVSLGTYKRY